MLTQYPVLSRILILFLDTIVTVLSYFLAMQLRAYIGLSEGLEWRYYVNLLLIIMIIWGGLLEYQEAYAGRAYKSGLSLSSKKSLKKEILIVLRTVLVGCPIVYFISYLINIFIPWEVPRSLVVIFGVINFLLLSMERTAIYKLIDFIVKSEKNLRKVLVLGTGHVAKQFVSLKDNQNISILGLIGNRECDKGKEMYGYKIVGCSGNLADILHATYIDELVLAMQPEYWGDMEEVIATCDKEGVPVRIVSPFFKNLISKSRAEVVGGLPNITFTPVERNDLEVAIKRIMDVLVSFIGLIILAPLFVVLTVIIKLDSPGPVFYKWKILGLHKRPLTSYKFRTMVENADELKKKLTEQNEMQGVAFKMQDDPRITRIGKWLRRYSLDELPQLWSVFTGDLSLVGPRPPLQTEVEHYEGWHRRKLSVKPGITCLWQVSGRNEINDFNDWMKLDLQYIDEWTLWMDIKILFMTALEVLKGSGR